ADDDTRPGGVDVDAYPVPGALDVHLGDAGTLQALGHHLADLHVLRDVVLVQLVGVPPTLPVGRDAEPEPVRVNLLTHYSVSSSAASAVSSAGVAAFLAGAAFFAAPAPGRTGVAVATDSTWMVMWQVRLRIRYARPCARGRNRLSVGPSSTY